MRIKNHYQSPEEIRQDDPYQVENQHTTFIEQATLKAEYDTSDEQLNINQELY